MLDGVLAEVVERAGGAVALAAELGVTTQAVYKFRVDGFPESRILQIERLTGVHRDRLRAYSHEKQVAKRRGKQWWEL